MITRNDNCWLRVFAKILKINPPSHSGFEVADVTSFEYGEGINFVIKAEPIEKPTGKIPDGLFRQCVTLFDTDNACIFYLNYNDTHPGVIQNILKAAADNKHHPSFQPIPRNHIKQIYLHYKNL